MEGTKYRIQINVTVEQVAPDGTIEHLVYDNTHSVVAEQSVLARVDYEDILRAGLLAPAFQAIPEVMRW